METSFLGINVFESGGASGDEPGISADFWGLDFTIELPRDGVILRVVFGPNLPTEEDRPGGAEAIDVVVGFDGRIVGVPDLDIDLRDATMCLAVGEGFLAKEAVDLMRGTICSEEGMLVLEAGMTIREYLSERSVVWFSVELSGLEIVET